MLDCFGTQHAYCHGIIWVGYIDEGVGEDFSSWSHKYLVFWLLSLPVGYVPNSKQAKGSYYFSPPLERPPCGSHKGGL